MKKYNVLFSEEAKNDIKKMNSFTSQVILGWVRTHLDGCWDPRTKGRGLTPNHSERWRYKAGNWRVITSIDDDAATILVLTIRYNLDIAEI